MIGAFDIEHFQPIQHAPERQLDYENLLYSCRSCNSLKGTCRVADPLEVLLSKSVRIQADNRIEGLTKNARKIIDIIGLDDPAYRERRRIIYRIVTLSEQHDTLLYRMLLGFPKDLPNLSRLRPPKNTRPKGIEASFFAQFMAGTLPAIY